MIHRAENDELIDWNTVGPSIKPSWISEDAWPIVFSNLQHQIGTTWGDYIRMLGRNADYLARFDLKVQDVESLFGFELRKAAGLDFGGAIATSVDAGVPAPGIPLAFTRSFGNTINERFSMGPFGRGWIAPWQISLIKETDGTIIVKESADSFRQFKPDSRKTGAYFSQTGDAGVLTRIAGGAYKLVEPSGFNTWFYPDGKLDYIGDVNANFITTTYAGDQLIALTHSSGGSMQMSYNAAGLIASVSDSTGWSTLYSYDATNTYLTSSTNPSGTTSYTYADSVGEAKQHALTAITEPGGLTTHFEYDARGRLTKTSLGGNVEPTHYSYTAEGIVSRSDASGTTVRNFFDHRGLVVRSQDNLDHFLLYSYNELSQLVKLEDSTGRTVKINGIKVYSPQAVVYSYYVIYYHII